MVISEEHSAPLASFPSLRTKPTVQVWLVLCQAITIMVHGMHCQTSPLYILPFCGTAFHAIFTVTPNLGALTNNSKKCRESLLLLVIKLLDERTISALQHVNTEQSAWQNCAVANITVRFVHCSWEAFATGIKNLDRWKSSLIAWLLHSEALDCLILREFKGQNVAMPP